MGPPRLDHPGLLGPLKSFRARHARAVETGEDDQAVERLARLVRPFLLRRKKSDPGIVPELPPKTETDHPVPLTREQAALYEAVVRESMTAIETAQGMGRRGLVLKLLTSLKQICDHPALYLKEEHAPAATASPPAPANSPCSTNCWTRCSRRTAPPSSSPSTSAWPA